MKKFISLALALVMALSLATMAWGESYAYDGSNNGEACVVLNTTNGVTYDGANATANLTAGTGEYDAGVAMTGSGDFVIENVSIATTKRGIEGNDIAGDVTIDNVVVTGAARALHVYTTSASDLTVTNSVFEGKVSFYLAGGSATFTNCIFKSSGVYDDVVEPWSDVTFVDCVFEGDVKVSFEDVTSGAVDVTAIEVDECYYEDGQPVTAASLYSNYTSADHASLVTLDPAPAVAEVDGKQYVSVDYAIAAAGASDEIVLLDSSAAVPAGYIALLKTDGTSVIVPAVTFGDKFDLYLADSGMAAALKAKTPDVAGLSFTEVAAKTNKDGSGNVAYIAANNGQFFVKTSAPTVSDYAVTDAGKTTVLYYVTVAGTDAANFEYVESVSAFNKFSAYAKCDYVTGTPVAGKDYFMASDDLVYMAGAAGTGTNYLLNGKVVSGTYAGTPETHSFTLNGYKYDATLKKNVPTSALCTKCMMNTSSIYLRTKVPATYTLYTTTGEGSVDYVVAFGAAAAPVVGTTGNTVQSAQTFDAGIAMYVGMSVMAAAGSAVVIGKKKD